MRDADQSYRATLQNQRRLLFDRYATSHLARKVVGVGSVGTRAWIVLFVGRDDGEPLFLQVKEAAAVGARAVRWARASSATRAGASSKGSG